MSVDQLDDVPVTDRAIGVRGNIETVDTVGTAGKVYTDTKRTRLAGESRGGERKENAGSKE
jgi:hypothetical protein